MLYEQLFWKLTMIIMDLSQVMIATLMVQLGNHKDNELDENMLRHMVLNSIRYNKTKFAPEYGELVIAADAPRSWRRNVYPYYKAARRKSREESTMNWGAIFDSLHKIREEIKENFPYKVLRVELAEADDVISVLTKHTRNEPILILSGDKDFQQLQKYDNVKQYSPPMKKWIQCKNPQEYLMEHIFRGDVSDGVPNILSADDTFVSGSRQKPISSKKIESWIKDGPEAILNFEQYRNFSRNRLLIDFDYIPEDIQSNILNEYINYQGVNDKSKLMNYFMQNKLKHLTDNINDF